MLAAGNFGDDAAEAGVEIHLGRHHVRAQNSPAVDDGGGRLVAGGLDGEDERTVCRNLAGPCVSRSILAAEGGASGAPAEFVRDALAVRNRCQGDGGQRALHDEGVLAVGVVARAAAQHLVAEGRIQRLGPGVCGTYFQRTRARPQVAGVVGHAGEQDASDAVAAPCGIHSHLQNLQVAVDHPAAGITHQRRLGGKRHLRVRGVGGPPHAVGAAQFVGHKRPVPRIGSHHGRLQGRHIGHMARVKRLVGDALAIGPGVGDGRVVHGHVPRSALARQGAVGPGQALPLVLLGVRQARVHGQGEGRIVALGVEGIALPRAPCGPKRHQEARARRRPQRLGQKRARAFEKIRVLAQGIARDQAIGGTCRAELFGEGIRLDHAVGGHALHPRVAQAVFHGIHLAAHGVGHDEQ